MIPICVSRRWSVVDFGSANGGRFRVGDFVDDYGRELVRQPSKFPISGHWVDRELEWMSRTSPRVTAIVCDNGPEFTSMAMLWSAMPAGVAFYQAAQTDPERLRRVRQW